MCSCVALQFQQLFALFAVQIKIKKTSNTAVSDMITAHHIGKAKPVCAFTIRCNCNAKLYCNSAAYFMMFLMLSGVDIE